MKPDEVGWTERKEHAAEHPPTGAPKQGSLLTVLADEALSKGRPVLVIPLDAAAPEAEPPAEEEELVHGLKLPKNTTVIFSGKEGFPASSEALGEAAGDLGDETYESNGSSGTASRATPVRVADPGDPASLGWRPLEQDSKLLARRRMIFASLDRGKVSSEGAHIADDKYLTSGEVKHLEEDKGSGEGSCEE